jgi:thiosulfate dehydrogenase [quinone] large subunit
MSSNAARRQKAAAARSTPDAPAAEVPADMWQLRGSDGSVAVGWYLLPLRLFLGVTFLFAGLQKLSNPDFFRVSAPGSIHAQMVGASHTSPIGSILVHLVGAAPAIGLVIALAEVAIGIGALLGLLTRVAALGGMLVAFSLFLAISFHTSPYYTGSDIVFVFAWIPFVLAGAGGAPALDTWLAVPAGATSVGTAGAGAVSRRDVVSKGAVIGMVAGGTAVLAGVVAGLGRVLAPTRSTNAAGTLPAPSTTTATTVPPATTAAGGTATTAPAPTSTTAAAPKGTNIGSASSVPVGGSASFTDPTSGDPSLVIQHTADQFVAFDAICPHAGCTVAYQSGANIIACPCHGSEFDPKTGAVVLGPATNGLTPIKVIKGANGSLYVV